MGKAGDVVLHLGNLPSHLVAKSLKTSLSDSVGAVYKPPLHWSRVHMYHEATKSLETEFLLHTSASTERFQSGAEVPLNALLDDHCSTW